jgi:hypothetical protein
MLGIVTSPEHGKPRLVKLFPEGVVKINPLIPDTGHTKERRRKPIFNLTTENDLLG